MSRFLALNISISDDGYMAGPNQSLDEPMGENGRALHDWVFPTQAMQKWFGGSGGTTGIDNNYAARGFTNVGATIMGRNMFGPLRGDWLGDEWRGWWGAEPSFQHPVFILTHYQRESIDMGNGTVFHFITGGIEAAKKQSLASAAGKDIRVGGGANTIQQFLEAGILDEIHLAVRPMKLGAGERLFTHPELQLAHYRALDPVLSETVVHQTYVKI